MLLKETIVTGTTIEEAIANGCALFGVDEEDVSVEVLEYPQKKTFGLFGGSPAKVRVYFDDGTDEPEVPAEKTEAAEPMPETKPEPPKAREEKKEPSAPKAQAPRQKETQEHESKLTPMNEEELGGKHQAVVAANYLRGILAAMGLDKVNVEIMSEEDKPGAVLNLTGAGLGTVIGRRGDTLSALQYLVSLAANNGDNEYYRIAINIGDYREKREYALESLARKTAYRSQKIGRNLALEPMNPFERRIVHTAVQAVEGVTSWSVGEGARRHVVIGPVGNEGEDGLPVNSNGRGRHRQGNSSYGGRGGYNRQGGGRRGGYGGNGRGGGYHKKSGNYGGGYNRRSRYSGESKYDDTVSAASAPRRDTTAPLYGRIEVPKREESKRDED